MFDYLQNMFDFNINWFSVVGLNSASAWDKSQVFIGLVSLLVAIASLFIAYKTLRMAKEVQQAIASNHAKEKQVETMCELVAFLNDARIRVVFRINTDGSNMRGEDGVSYNLFEIGYLNENDMNWSDFDDCKVFFSQNTNKIVDVVDYINNPFIPKKIADELKKFVVFELGDSSTQRGEVVFICSDEKESFDYKTGKEIVRPSFTWATLKQQSQKLTKVVSDWFKENNIDDFNIRCDDFKYPL